MNPRQNSHTTPPVNNHHNKKKKTGTPLPRPKTNKSNYRQIRNRPTDLTSGSKSKKNARHLRTVGPHQKKPIEGKPPEWVVNINNCLKEAFTYDSGRYWTIYRVPSNMREVHRSAFVPKIISVGPFHYGDQRLQPMEEPKMRYLLRLLGGNFEESKRIQNGGEHTAESRKAISLEDLAEAMKGMEQKTRGCYSEFFDISSDDFVQMMVTDGCFVIELLRLYYKFDSEENVNDPIFTTRWMLRTLQRDLLMLENQLPFPVLNKLYVMTSSGEEPSLQELIVTFFDPLLPRENPIAKLDSTEEYDHLLDVFRSTFLATFRNKEINWKLLQTDANLPLVMERQLIHCAMELQEAGVALRKREGFDLLDIAFNHGVLQIPPMSIDDNTVPLFLNFVAYEQSDEDAEPFFTNYFMFLDSLVNSNKDIQILHKYGIINHVLGSDKGVADLVNKLGREIVHDLDQCYLSVQMKDVNSFCRVYYESRWHVWWGNLIRERFSSPWTFLSLLAAIFLLLLTASQTFYTIYPYYHPS